MTSTLKVLIKVKDLLLSNFYRLCLTAFYLVNPYLLFRIADCFFIAGVICTMFVHQKVWCLYFDVCFYSVGSGLFWPVVGSTVGKEAPIGKENRNSNNALFVAVACAGSCLIIYPIRLPKEVIEREKQKKKQQEEHKDQKDIPVDVKVTPVDGDEDLEIPIDVVDDLEAQTGVDIEEVKSDHVEGHDLEEVIVADPKRIRYKWNIFQLKNKTYIYLGFILNFSIVGCASVLSNQYIKLVKQKGLKVYLPLADPPEMYMALFFFLFYLSQTIALVIMSFTTIWTYKRSLILAGQAMIMFLFVMVAVSDSEVVLLILSFIGGFVAGFAYQTSTYYSLRASEQKKGFFVGISEGMAKLGMAFLPLFAGLLTNIFNNNYYISIYIGIIVVLLCTLLCQITYHVGYTINRWRQSKRQTPEVHEFEMGTLPDHDHTQTTVSEKQTTSQTENTNIAIDPSADEDDGGNDVNEVEIEVEENEQQQ
ncbi:Major facilitator superfamily transporter [Entamoeba marina]